MDYLAGLLTPAFLNGAGVVSVVLVVGLLIFFGQLIPGRTHRAVVKAANDQTTKAEARAERWEDVALKALQATERLAGPVETAAKVLTKMPNPARDGAET